VSASRLSISGAVIVAFMVAVAIAGIVTGYGIGITVPTGAQKAAGVTTASPPAPYVVTLVIATNSVFNATAGAQPAYFQLGPKGLESSANISLPANRLIKLVIVCYDDGNATLLTPNDNVVSGTADGTIFVASNDNINSSEGPKGVVVNGGQTLTSVPAADIAHTFTVPALNLNIPVPLSSTVVAYFTVSKAGTYLWFCETACGDAPMSTPGWMRGSLVAS